MAGVSPTPATLGAPTPSEALFAFGGWLTSRDEESGPFSGHHEATFRRSAGFVIPGNAMADRNIAMEIATALGRADAQTLAAIGFELLASLSKAEATAATLAAKAEAKRTRDRDRQRESRGSSASRATSPETGGPSPFSPTPPFSPPSSSPSSSREAEIARRLPSDQGRIALTALLATSGQKAAVLGEIEACLDGARGAQFKVTPTQMDMAISDYVANELSGGRFNAAHFRRHVQRAAQPQQNGQLGQRRGGVGQRSHDNALEALKDVG